MKEKKGCTQNPMKIQRPRTYLTLEKVYQILLENKRKRGIQLKP